MIDFFFFKKKKLDRKLIAQKVIYDAVDVSIGAGVK